MLFEHAPVAQFVSRADGSIVVANPAYAALVGVPLEEVVGSVPADITHPDDLPLLLREGGLLLAGEIDVIDLELRVRTADGAYRWCLATCSMGRDGAGAPVFVSQLLDVDARRRAEAELEASREQVNRLAGIAERTGDLVGVVDADGWVVWANEAARATHGFTPEQLPLDGSRLYTKESINRFFDHVLPVLQRGDRWIGELDMLAADGSVISIWQSLAPQLDADGRLLSISAVGRDLTDRKQREADLTHRATHDVLTGLPNRALLLDRLQAAMEGVRSSQTDAVALLFIDLDRFKTVNDQLGHDAGDELLRVIAERLAGSLRSVDVVARLGGDEFVVLCPGLGRAEAEDVALRLLLAVSSQPVHVAGRPIEVTASVGLTVSAGSKDHHAEGLLREADVAMYQAKAQGRNRFEVYDA